MGLGSMLMSGMAFGAGSAVAHQALGGMMGRNGGGGQEGGVPDQGYQTEGGV